MKLNLPTKMLIAVGLMGTFIPGPSPAISLKAIPVPEPPAIWRFIRNDTIAIQLGKALFWDMQVGSDGMTACATCHFHAGVDSRTRNTLNPDTRGAGVAAFDGSNAPNILMTKQHFPFVDFVDPTDPSQGLNRPVVNDVIGSQGVVKMDFVDIQIGNPVDLGTPAADPLFNVGGVNVRQVTDRNTPSVINAVYNFANFWDGRANNVFNGTSSFGAMDPTAEVFISSPAGLRAKTVRIRNGAMASQAMSPPVSDVEMSWKGRTWPKIGKKMLSLKPLDLQLVHPQDSVLGPISRSGYRPNGKLFNRPGLTQRYKYLIKKAFLAKYWRIKDQHLEFVDVNNPDLGLQIVDGAADPNNTDQFTQIEANFSFFFGMAVQRYLSTLVSDESPFDQYSEEVAVLGFSNTLTQEQQVGLTLFNGLGACTVCHGGAEFTNATVGTVLPDPNPPDPNVPVVPNPRRNPLNSMEMMAFTVGDALYDVDYLDLGVVPKANDPGRDNVAPFVNPANGNQPYPIGFSELALLKRDDLLPASVARFTPDLPVGFRSIDTSPGLDRVGSNGAFKVPSLRNVTLTGPYFHNGGMSTLMQIVDFYSRGGNFPDDAGIDKPIEISPIPFLRGNDPQERFLVRFLESLTDPRVAEESGPFDHPQLFVPHGFDFSVVPAQEIIDEIPPVGSRGRLQEGLQPLAPFLNVNQEEPKG